MIVMWVLVKKWHLIIYIWKEPYLCATFIDQGSRDFRYFIPKFTMGNVKSKRTLDISSTPKKDGVAVKVIIVTMKNI